MMSERKWTPGPWVIEGRPPNMKVFFSGTIPGNRRSPCMMLDDDQEANANLIAAAPDLFEALETLLRKFKNCARSHGNDDETIEEATAPTRAALAKARGE